MGARVVIRTWRRLLSMHFNQKLVLREAVDARAGMLQLSLLPSPTSAFDSRTPSPAVVGCCGVRTHRFCHLILRDV